ncbi:MLO-like protein 13 isoform X2 [Quercus suber]|uniref:MLO-like protein 13 isoform X2 n=1 Tax=Quercus suber TaxID=58331 RepID=UPI000D2C3D70|nr:mlo-like protein 13 [Quercus suber]
MALEHTESLVYTPTWVVATVCFIIVLISLCVERTLHRLGKFLKRKKQDELYAALQKLKEELMLLGFISLLLTVFQSLISRICIPTHLSNFMLPCKKRYIVHPNGTEHYSNPATNNPQRLLFEDTNSGHCLHEGKAPLLPLEALHQLHIFIFVLAVVHVIFCVTIMTLGAARIRQWKSWEDSIRKEIESKKGGNDAYVHDTDHQDFLNKRGAGYWRKAAVVSWMISLFKQFYGSVTKSDYKAMRQGFIKKHYPDDPEYNFHHHMMQTLAVDFKKVIGVSWYLWLFVVVFLLLNVAGWNTYFWLSFLPLILLLLVGAKLQHIITRLAQEVVVERNIHDHEAQLQVTETKRDNHEVHEAAPPVKPSDDYFWFSSPALVLTLIHFILFQNSFEIGFFFWILFTYGFNSCIMDKLGFIIPRLIVGLTVQVLCSYSTLPLYAIVTQMGSTIKKIKFEDVESAIKSWFKGLSKRREERTRGPIEASQIQMQSMAKESPQNAQNSEF